MNAGKQALWIFITLLLLAGSGWYFASTPIQAKLDKNTLDTTIDSIATQLSVKQYNIDGKIVSYLTTPYMHHIPKNNTHWLKTPFIKLSPENKAAWEIKAKEAISINGGDEVTFKNDVIIHQGVDAENKDSTLTTDILFYQPKSKYAWTDSLVIFEQAGNIVKSKGMKAFLETKHIQLLSEARATYAPKQG